MANESWEKRRNAPFDIQLSFIFAAVKNSRLFSRLWKSLFSFELKFALKSLKSNQSTVEPIFNYTIVAQEDGKRERERNLHVLIKKKINRQCVMR